MVMVVVKAVVRVADVFFCISALTRCFLGGRNGGVSGVGGVIVRVIVIDGYWWWL